MGVARGWSQPRRGLGACSALEVASPVGVQASDVGTQLESHSPPLSNPLRERGGPSEASPHPCHFRWSPQDPSSAALSLPHDSHQAPGAPGLPGQANQAPHSFQTLPLKAWPGGVLKGLRPSPRAGPGCPPPGGGGRPPPTPAAPSHCLKDRDALLRSWGTCSSTHKVVPESCVGRAGSEPVCPARPSPQCLPWRKVSPRRGRGARGPHLVSWGPALLPGAGFSGHACSHVGAPSLQGEAGPPGLPGPPVSVLLCWGRGGREEASGAWERGWAGAGGRGCVRFPVPGRVLALQRPLGRCRGGRGLGSP